MADRRATALDELATALAEATVDAWLNGELAGDGLTHNGKGTGHEAATGVKAPTKRRSRTEAKGVRNVRR